LENAQSMYGSMIMATVPSSDNYNADAEQQYEDKICKRVNI